MQVCLSYVHTKIQWIWPAHYQDVGFQLIPFKFKMAAIIRVKRGVQKKYPHSFCNILNTVLKIQQAVIRNNNN